VLLTVLLCNLLYYGVIGYYTLEVILYTYYNILLIIYIHIYYPYMISILYNVLSYTN